MHQLDPASAAEGLLLASLGAVVLLALAALDRPGPPPGGEPSEARFHSLLGLGASLAALILWVVPSGAVRGSAMAALLLFLLLRASWARLRETPNRLPLVVTTPLCVGLQALFQPEAFLRRSLSREVLLDIWAPPLAFALAAALALNLLARRHGARNSLLAGSAALLLGGGWSFVAAAGLFTLAAADLALGEKRAAPSASIQRPEILGWGNWTPAALLGLALGGAAAYGFPRRPLAFLVLLALSAALSAVRDRFESAGTRWLPWLGFLGLGALALLLEIAPFDPARSAPQALVVLGCGLILLPQGLLTPGPAIFAALLLSALAGRWLPGSGLDTAGSAQAAVGAAMAFLALALPEKRRGGAAQNLWMGLWLLVLTLAAGYPWLRRGGLRDLAEAFPDTFGWGGWTLALGGLLLVAMGWGAEPGLRILRRSSSRRIPKGLLPAILGFLVLAGTLLGLPPAGETVLMQEAVTLTRERPRWQSETGGRGATKLVVISNLANAADLPEGQPVAVIRLRHADGRTSLAHLKAGTDTAEWAARRPDVARRPDLAVPPAWQVAAAPDGPYFAQRYRSVHDVELGEPIVAVDVFRRRSLPPEVSVTLFRVELLP